VNNNLMVIPLLSFLMPHRRAAPGSNAPLRESAQASRQLTPNGFSLGLRESLLLECGVPSSR
jgi:hypothetical protein